MDMLIVLHICLFPMSHDKSYTSLEDSETIVLHIISNNQSSEMYCDFLGKFDFKLHYSLDGSYIGLYSQPLRMLR